MRLSQDLLVRETGLIVCIQSCCIFLKIRISRGFGWRIHCGVEVTELKCTPANKQQTLSLELTSADDMESS
jgi:hypothetical protein